MKKRLIIILICLLLLSACQKNPSINKEVTIEGSIFSGVKQGRVNTSLIYDDAWITTNDNQKYNCDLAKLSLMLTTDSYFRAKDLDKGTQNRVLLVDDEEYDYTKIFKALGFEDFEHIETFKEKEYDYDSNDSVTMNLAYKNVDNKYDTFIVVIRGCLSAGEWSASFDVGSPSVDYFNLTGKHPEWEHTDINKDIDIAANRAKEYIEEFVAAHDSNKPNTMLLTGHSRGASIANEIGSEFEENNYARMYTYLFNGTDMNLNPKDSNTIFNIYDQNDFFKNVFAFKNEKYDHSGRDISEDISNNKELQKIICELVNNTTYTCPSKEFLEAYSAIFGHIFPNRESLYKSRKMTFSFDSKELAQTKVDEIVELITDSSLNLADYILIGSINENGDKYDVEIEYFGHTVLLGLSRLLAYGNTVYDGLKHVFEKDEEVINLYSLVNDNIAQITGGHYLINDYVIINK